MTVNAFERVEPLHEKLGGYDFYKSIGSPQYVVAPMVDQSELAWRLLSKSPLPEDMAGPSTKITPEGSSTTYTRYVGGAHLSYTPMIHSMVFNSSRGNGADTLFNLSTDEEGSHETLVGVEGGDRPLFAQFCANDPEVLLEAALKVQDRVDAVDINLGCPQGIAKKGHYGSFLQDEWELIHSLISTLHKNLKVPVTAKFRVFPDVEKTVRYAQMLEAAGAQILTCHGRTREMKGQLTGVADWEQIAAVKKAVKVPVFANGNILYREDVDACLEQTGVDGVMSAEGNLHNPAVFMPADHEHAYTSSLFLARRYLDIVDSLETPTLGSAVKAHMFRLLKPTLDRHREVREQITATGMDEDGRTTAYRALLDKIEALCAADEPKLSVKASTIDKGTGYRPLPYWVSQPYIRGRMEEIAKGEFMPNKLATATEQATKRPANHVDSCKGTAWKCGATAAAKCANTMCLTHCRAHNAVLGGMDPEEANKLAQGGGLVGQGCADHEEKVLAREKRKREQAVLKGQKRARRRGEYGTEALETR
ncbi:tRNA-dihydrouridine(16/17) synthase [NAD(P)(+)]-like [Vanrija pseudolonga]|uniref:tRNA-dihydrouridine(16/17) synthase [NAD(P)(+)] n=1 Tax=Vanrija pseudolonga TaxID=143232 RepID=A0AAF0YK29_9TREE|nr:tRNA-dihydrouridine(16/17) synthase [NAD(P)(+)]-like [Vanrija pseudolonga]